MLRLNTYSSHDVYFIKLAYKQIAGKSIYYLNMKEMPVAWRGKEREGGPG